MNDLFLEGKDPLAILDDIDNHDCKGEKCEVCLKVHGEAHED